jgi:TonB family protein
MIEHDPTLLLEMLEDERVSNRRRETFFVSVIIHLALVLLIVTQPNLFSRLIKPADIGEPVNPRDVTMLYEPPNLPKLKAPPKTRILSDANRKAQRGLQNPPMAKSQPTAPPPPGPAKSPEPAAPKAPEETKIARELPPIGIPEFPEPPKEPPKQRPSLEPVPPPQLAPPPSRAQLMIPDAAPPSNGTDAILRGMAKQHATGRGDQGMGGGGYPDLNPHDPNLNIPGPQILSDTMGVDFNPYLLRILSLVRRNWYAVIPEIARLGKQGRVVLQFAIKRNGGVAELVLAAGSGTDSLDGAAVSSIRLSNPFPPLPAEFPGQDIKLRFVYLYNMRVDY